MPQLHNHFNVSGNYNKPLELTYDPPKARIEIASNVDERDGIGVEIYKNDELVIKIFRDVTSRMRTVTVFKPEVLLEMKEEVISDFKKEIS